VDVLDDGEVIRILVELPGIEADDVKVTIRGRVVMIRGTKKGRIRTKEGMRFFCMERYFGGFLKSVAIPRPVNSHHAKTRMKNGLLEVILPRVPDLREKEIEIPVLPEPEE
jgi:HSP20 family protein